MEINDFISEFADVFDETDIKELKPETNFRELEEWSSLHALATINMVERVYGKKVEAMRMKKVNTIQELFDLVLIS